MDKNNKVNVSNFVTDSLKPINYFQMPEVVLHL